MSLLASLPNARPVLQIVHVSDLHVVATKHSASTKVRALERLAFRLGIRPLWEKLRDGTAPSDLYAPMFFRLFLSRITSGDQAWRNVATWLVDTGDQTTYGDASSVSEAQKILDGFAVAMGSSPNHVVKAIWGNHDAWPDDLPIAARANIAAHTQLLTREFTVGSAAHWMRAPIPGTQSEIQLCSIDTVDVRWQKNTLALGFVAESQLAQLDAYLNAHGAASPNLRILLTHHPVHYPPRRPRLGMALANDFPVGRRLESAQPAVDLVLSGHTHALYPALGQLPPNPQACPHDPLGQDQVQLVVGTLMQTDPLNKRGDYPHQCQVLRFFHDAGTPNAILLQRRLAARNPYAANPSFDFDFIDPPDELMVPL